MSLKKSIYEADFRLDFDLDPPVSEWKVASSGREKSGRETYKSAGYLISLEEHRKPTSTVVGFNLKREDGREFTVKQYVLSAYSYIYDIHRIWIPHFTERHIALMYLLRNLPFSEVSPHNRYPLIDCRSCADSRVPIILGMNRKGMVTFAVGFIDQRIETMIMDRIATHYNSPELDRGRMVFQFKRPIHGFTLGPITEYKDGFFVSRGQFWYDTMHEYRQVHDEWMNRPVKPSPDPCWDPLWVPWTYKPREWGNGRIEDVDEELLLKYAKIAVKLGFRSIINMDSWFFSSKYPGWGYPQECGDYVPDTSKFPDFRGTARKLHQMGMRLCVWIDPFAVGKDSKMSVKMKDALVPNTHFLCPRNPTAQKHMSELMARVMRDYDVDGYTVDCGGNVPLAPCTANHEHNFSSIGMALDYCYAEMKAAMDRVKPEAIIEFSHNYSNINCLNYATAFRATDSGDTGDFELDRRLCVLLRSFIPSGKAVHFDPLWWRLDEDDKTVAKMLSTAVVSAVPQVAADFGNYSESHLNLMKGWLSFYHQHKQDFRYGQMKPIQNDPQFSTIMVSSPGKAFISYGNYPALRVPVPKDANEIFLFNCTLEDSLYTILQGVKGEYKAELYDHTLTAIGEKKVKSRKEEALVDLNILQGGYSLLKKT